MTRAETRVTASLDFPQSRPIRDMQRVTALFCGLMRDYGQTIRFTGQSAAGQTRIDTSDYTLRLSVSDGVLSMQLDATGDEPARRPECLLARLVRAASAVLRPSAIRWREGSPTLDIATWLSAFRPVQPRRVRPQPRHGTAGRTGPVGVAIWPDRPCDLPQPRRVATTRDGTAERFAHWRPMSDPASATNRVDPETLLHRLSSWALAGTTAVLYPPAGVSMAVMTLGRRADLRLNLHALTLTLVILSLHQSGALATTIRALGF
jgi:hypothetical protein